MIGEHKYRRADERTEDDEKKKQPKTKKMKQNIQTSCREIDMVIHLKRRRLSQQTL
jgi:hypothetical protein